MYEHALPHSEKSKARKLINDYLMDEQGWGIQGWCERNSHALRFVPARQEVPAHWERQTTQYYMVLAGEDEESPAELMFRTNTSTSLSACLLFYRGKGDLPDKLSWVDDLPQQDSRGLIQIWKPEDLWPPDRQPPNLTTRVVNDRLRQLTKAIAESSTCGQGNWYLNNHETWEEQLAAHAGFYDLRLRVSALVADYPLTEVEGGLERAAHQFCRENTKYKTEYTPIARFCARKMGLKDPKFTHELQEMAAQVQSTVSWTGYKVELVTGSAITEAYVNRFGCSSCMTGHPDLVELYEINPDQVALAKVTGPDGTHFRALVWHHKDDKSIWRDRIYPEPGYSSVSVRKAIREASCKFWGSDTYRALSARDLDGSEVPLFELDLPGSQVMPYLDGLHFISLHDDGDQVMVGFCCDEMDRAVSANPDYMEVTVADCTEGGPWGHVETSTCTWCESGVHEDYLTETQGGNHVCQDCLDAHFTIPVNDSSYWCRDDLYETPCGDLVVGHEDYDVTYCSNVSTYCNQSDVVQALDRHGDEAPAYQPYCHCELIDGDEVYFISEMAAENYMAELEEEAA